jgi:lipopolysaccharide transport system permease protein
MTEQPASLTWYIRSLLAHRDLIYRMVEREFTQRFRGSVLGAVWAILTPLLTALVYTFVFGTVFKARWGGSPADSQNSFTVILLTGVVVHSMFAEALGRAPVVVLSNAGYVKKVVFPLEILPVVAVCTALVNASFGLVIVLMLNLALTHAIHPTVLLLPVVLFPYLLFITGLVLFLGATGVYVRDLSQIVGLLITVSLFLTPIFYPITAVPASFQRVMWLNPLTFIVEQTRGVLLFGSLPDWRGAALYTAAATLLLAMCFWWFQRTRNGFADVM